MCKNRAIFLPVIGLVILLSAGFFLFRKPDLPTQKVFTPPQSQNRPQKSIQINDIKIFIEIAETLDEKARGLSGRTTLSGNQGMIFIFSYKTYPSFWMIDMKIPLDIIWISDNTIIHIDENVQPPENDVENKDLPLYRPPEAINYVLEVNAGFSQKNNIKVGDTVDLTALK